MLNDQIRTSQIGSHVEALWPLYTFDVHELGHETRCNMRSLVEPDPKVDRMLSTSKLSRSMKAPPSPWTSRGMNRCCRRSRRIGLPAANLGFCLSGKNHGLSKVQKAWVGGLVVGDSPLKQRHTTNKSLSCDNVCCGWWWVDSGETVDPFSSLL